MKIGRLSFTVSGTPVVLEGMELTLEELDEIIEGVRKLITEYRKPIQPKKIESVV